MTETIRLYHLAEANGIPVLYLPLPECGSLCMPLAGGAGAVGMDLRWPSPADERVHMAHELGHCLTGSFYNRDAALELRQKLENRADRRAIELLIPRAGYAAALDEGCTELWQLAERFCVTEDFARKAVCLYLHGNLSVESYAEACP